MQRLYYNVETLKITCQDPSDDFPTYRDLEKDVYTAAAFSGSAFTDILNPSGSSSCNGSEEDCLFSTVESVEYDTFDDTNADLFVQRFLEVPMYLKCLDRNGYGPSIANVLIEAMDEFFSIYVTPELEKEILINAPGGSVYNFASPYDNGRVFFTHGMYYTGGNLIAQVKGEDGYLTTKYTYAFDTIWFWPHDATDDILPNLEALVNSIFDEGAFLDFLQQEYSQYGYIRRADFCEPVDTMPDFPEIPVIPTPVPTAKPTFRSEIGEECASDAECVDGLLCHGATGKCVCNVDTDFGCDGGNICEIYEKDEVPRCYCDMYNDNGQNGCTNGQACRFSCAYLVDNPRCFDDAFVRDCTAAWGDGFTCADANNDGVIDQSDKSGGCDYNAPTSAPQISTDEPTKSPVVALVTPYPSVLFTPVPTIEVTMPPTMTKPAITAPPTMTNPTPMPSPFPSFNPLGSMMCDSNSTNTCPDELCCVDDTCQDCVTDPGDGTKPIVGTCGNGNRGDGICAWEGYCCSEWGWCGTTEEYCSVSSIAPTPSDGGFYPPPTPSVDAGKCGLNEIGEGICANPDHCCSEWGYCGPGEG